MTKSVQNRKTKIKVSVIMALYNVELFMRTAIESVLNQSLKDIELICINDGSSDYSLDTAKEYAEKDNRIKIISYEKSQGQAYARNRGLEIAKGKYIGFVDGDDWVEPDMFEKLYNNAEENKSDISLCATVLYDDLQKKTIFQNRYYNLSLISSDFDNKVFTAADTKDLLTGCINVALWNKIYRNDFMKKHKIRFPEHFIYEDMPFFYNTWFNAEKISLIRDFCYYYRVNRSGSTMSKIGNKVLDRVPMVALTYEMFKQQPFFNDIKTKVVSWIIDDLFHRYTLVEARYRKEFFFLMKKMFQNLDLENVDKEELVKCYCYKEYLNCLSMKYEDFCASLLETYVQAKKMKQELKSEMGASKYKLQTFYDKLINDIKHENTVNLRNQEKVLLEAYEKRMNTLFKSENRHE